MDIKIEKLDESQLRPVPEDFGFGNVFANRMYSQEYADGSWGEAKIGAYSDFTMSPASSVFHYGQEIFEGLKAYRRPDGHVNLFRPWENAKRFNNSASRMSMPMVDVEDHVASIAKLVEIEQEWVPSAAGSSLYVRPTMIATDSALGMRASSRYKHFVIVGPVGNYYASGMAPVAVYISDEYRRAAHGGTGAAKTGGNYAASMIASEQAKQKGYVQVLWIDSAQGKYVEEVGTMNIMFVYGGKKIVTPKLTGSILPGITRDSLLKMAPDLGYEVVEEMIEVEQMLADIESGAITEVFGCGTAVVVSPVGRFGYRGKDYCLDETNVGPVAQHLYDELTAIQFGRKEDPYGWTMKIEVE